MKKFTNWMLLSICLIILSGANVSAQDFGQLLEAVDKLEVSLKGMVESEADQRHEAITSLQSELQSLKDEMQKWQGQPAGETSADLSGLKTELERLAKENKELYQQLAGLTSKIIEITSPIFFLYDFLFPIFHYPPIPQQFLCRIGIYSYPILLIPTYYPNQAPVIIEIKSNMTLPTFTTPFKDNDTAEFRCNYSPILPTSSHVIEE